MDYMMIDISALHQITDPIRYVSSILSINIRYVSQYFLHYRQIGLKPTEICDVERSFYDINITFSDAKPITSLNDAFISYTPQSLCDYDVKYNKKHCLIGQMPMRMASSTSSQEEIS